MNPQRIISSIGVGAAAVLLGLGIQYAVAQTWNAAPSSPPSNNVPAPINVGSGSQIKLGGLSVLGQGVASGSSTLDVEGVGYIRGLVLGSGNSSPLMILDGNQGTTGSVLTNIGGGQAEWQCSGGSGSSYSSVNQLSNSSGNNASVLQLVATLSPGTYTFTGSGTDSVDGGAGIDAVFFSPTNYTTGSIGSNYPLEVSATGKYNQGGNITYYYNSNTDPSIIYAVSRTRDTGSVPWSIPANETITFTQTEHVYLIMGQSVEVGTLNINGATTGTGSCSGNSGTQTVIAGVTSITAGSNITVTPSNGTGNVQISTTPTQSTGTVGGGCYASAVTSNSKNGSFTGVTYSSWGIANTDCTCPSGYTSQVIGNSVVSQGSNVGGGYSLAPAGYLCLKN